MAAKELGLNRLVTEQPPYNILDRRIERELVPMAQTSGIALIPWSPIAGGLPSGKYRRGEAAPEGSRFADAERNPRGESRLVDGVYEIVERLDSMAQAKDCTIVQLALAWVPRQPGITSPIVGPGTLAQFDEYLGAPTVRLTDADRAQIDACVPPGGMVSPFYQAGFAAPIPRALIRAR